MFTAADSRNVATVYMPSGNTAPLCAGEKLRQLTVECGRAPRDGERESS